MLADGNVEFHLLVAFIGLGAAQIPGDAGTAQHRTRKAPVPAFFRRHHGDVDIALLEDAVFDEKFFQIVADLQERVAPGANIFDQLGRQILATPPGRK